ncbi:MAG: hypothetical protein MJ233_03435 [Mycoplasmoidaceae bacterium]|nr:hypothetical protein [Mycoplasmoidaceae bacterium]
MKASKFLNIFIPVIAGTSIAAVPAGIYIGNQGIFHFQVKVSSLDDCATLNNTGATIGRDYVTSISLKEGYTVESFDILVGGERLPGYAYAYAPNPQKLIIYGKYITSQDVSITVNTTSQPAGRSFETDS